jgi:putative DNA primase/helicase
VDIDDLNKNFSVSTLVNKRVNVCDETSNKYIDSHVLKSLISGEDQTCDVKNKKQIQFKPEVKIIVTVNDLPSISDTSYGLYRRFIIMDMKESFTVEKGNLDPNLPRELAKEKEIILKWALLGYQDLEKEGEFNIQQSNVDSLGAYRIDNDAVERFIVNAFQPMESSSYTLIEVYTEYRTYCQSIGKTAKNIGNFAKDLRRNYRCGELFKYDERENGHDTVKVSGIKINPKFLSEFDGF